MDGCVILIHSLCRVLTELWNSSALTFSFKVERVLLKFWSVALDRCLSSVFLSRLAPLYFSAQVLWVLIGLSAVGILLTFLRVYLNVDLLQELGSALSPL
uniref:Uncharacterized protein n=1 Tax=Oryzias sinensis TaxID=183150 RepID=A0A8C8DHJ5_9TELE